MNDDLQIPRPSVPPRKWLSYLEQGGLALVAIGSIAIGVLDFGGFLEGTVLRTHIASMTLVIIGLMAAYLVLERRGSIERLSDSLREVMSKLSTIDKATSRVMAVFEGLAGDRFAELKLIYGLRGYNARVAQNEVRGDRSQVFDLWVESLREATSFLAFNYVSPDEVWGTKGFAFDLAHAMQISRLRLGCIIKRVFVIDGLDEYKLVKDLMILQRDSGIEVKWILKSDILHNSLISQYIKELGTWDFVVIDTDWLFCVEIDDARKMTGCSLKRSRDLHQKGLHVFREALQSGHNPQEVPFTRKSVGAK